MVVVVPTRFVDIDIYKFFFVFFSRTENVAENSRPKRLGLSFLARGQQLDGPRRFRGSGRELANSLRYSGSCCSGAYTECAKAHGIASHCNRELRTATTNQRMLRNVRRLLRERKLVQWISQKTKADRIEHLPEKAIFIKDSPRRVLLDCGEQTNVMKWSMADRVTLRYNYREFDRNAGRYGRESSGVR